MQCQSNYNPIPPCYPLPDDRIFVDLTELIAGLLKLRAKLEAQQVAAHRAEAEALFRFQIDGEANEAVPVNGGPGHG